MRDYSRVTFMFCLPRSRSQWFAWLINKSSNTVAWHDPLKRCGHPNTLVLMIDKFLDDNPDKRLFIADTAAVMFFRYFTMALSAPSMSSSRAMNYFFVRRQFGDVLHSMREQTGKWMTDFLIKQGIYLDHVSVLHPSPIVEYNSIALKNVRKLWMWITKGDYITEKDLYDAMATVVDTPVRDQVADPDLVRSLLAYRENA